VNCAGIELGPPVDRPADTFLSHGTASLLLRLYYNQHHCHDKLYQSTSDL